MKHVDILTSREDTPGMNTVIHAIVRKSIFDGVEVYDINYGFVGLVAGDIRRLDIADAGDKTQHGGVLLYFARYPESTTEEEQLKEIERLKKFGIEGLVVVGENSPYHGAMASTEHGFPTVGIPRTIDNGILGTDFTIGLSTTVGTVLESIDRVRNTAISRVRTFATEVVGRNAGDIALWSGVAGGADEIIIPEHDLDMKGVARHIQGSRSCGKRHCLIILAEGVMGGNEFVDKPSECGDFRTRVSILGHVVRGGSPGTRDRVLVSKFGLYIVRLLEKDKGGLHIGVLDNQVVAADIIDTLENNKHKPDLPPYELDHEIPF